MSEDTRKAVLQRLDGNKKKAVAKKKSWKFDLKQGLDNLSNYVNGNKKKPVKKPISGKKSPVKHLTPMPRPISDKKSPVKHLMPMPRHSEGDGKKHLMPMPRPSVGDDRVHAQPYKGDGKKHLMPMPRPSKLPVKHPMPEGSVGVGEPISKKKAPIKKTMYNGPLNDAIKRAAANRIAKRTTTEKSVS